MKNFAIVLAAGNGSRMGADIPKQYIDIEGKPLIVYSLETFQNSNIIDSIILVTRTEDIEYCQTEIVKKYNITKVAAIVSGGAQRYDSVMRGLEKVNEDGIVFVHDGARPCVTEEIIDRLFYDAITIGSAVAAVRAKDTIKIADTNDNVLDTPDRNYVWQIQTPQAFNATELKHAYEKYSSVDKPVNITDDAMIMELYGGGKVHLVEADYRNIKVTTPEDIDLATVYIKKIKKL